MNNMWIEPRARAAPAFTQEQVERGQRLAGRDDLLTAERQHTRVVFGDLGLEIVPDHGQELDAQMHTVLRGFAAAVGVPAGTVREYRRVAAEFTTDLRERIARTGVTLSYSVIREAAIDAAGSGRPAEERWEALLRMVGEAACNGERVTAQRYRQAIGARLTVDAGIGLTPERILKQLGRDDVRDAVVACITEPEYLRDVLKSDPGAETRLRDSLAAVTRHLPHPSGPSSDSGLPEEGDEKLLRQLRRRVSALRAVVQLHPEQILNIADRATLDELAELVHSLATWIAQLQRRKVPA